MATFHTLRARYENVLRIDAAQLSETQQAWLTELSGKVDTGELSLEEATAEIIEAARGTTSVANLAYQFFTDAVPREAGLDFLVSPTGPNPNNLNSAYYQFFSTENRYINFAVNLGKGGEGRTAFEAEYGALSMTQTVSRAYAEIFGVTPDAAKIDALANTMVPDGRGGQFTRWEYFATYGGDGTGGIGTKAAFVGWLLHVAALENLGPYAAANEAFLADLAGDGQAAFLQNILEVYGPDGAPVAGATISVAANQSVSPTATDAALKSTANDDKVTGAGGLDAVQSVITGDGRDTVTFAGTAAGLIDTGDGADTITVAVLPGSVLVIGGAENGLIRAGAGDDMITVTQNMAFGSHIDAGAGEDTVVVAFNPADIGSPAPKFTGVEHLVISEATGFGRTLDMREMGDLQDIVFEGDNGFTFTNIASGLPLTLRDVEGGVVNVGYERVNVGSTKAGLLWSDASSADIRLDGVTTSSAPGDTPAELVITNLEGPLRLTVESDSALSGLSGASTVVVLGDGVLTIDGKLSANALDASEAAEIHIGRFNGAKAVLSDGADTIASDLTQSLDLTLGDGADTFSLYDDGIAATGFSNLRVEGQSVASYAKITDFTKGEDHVVLGDQVDALTALTTFVGDATTLEAALVNVSSKLAANDTGVFEYKGSTYIYHQDATVGVNTGDGLIQLVGVTALTTGTGAGPFDIHYG